MKGLSFNYRDIAQVSSDSLLKEVSKLDSYQSKLKDVLEKMDYDSDEASLLLPDADRGAVEAALDSYKDKKIRYVVVVGIGGSNLGTQCIYNTFLGDVYIADPDAPQMLFLDTTDSRHTANIISKLERDVQSPEEFVINIISKSGGTTETIANFEVLYKELSTRFGDIKEQVVVTTDEGSRLWVQAESRGILALPIPKKVGGRYSVFSSVGLFPLGVCGLDIKSLLQGAKDARDECLLGAAIENPAIVRAAILKIHAKEGVRIHNSFFFNPELESVGKWYRQLVGESLGKEYNNNEERVREGITPIVSVGSTDLHSMAQLYLGGPKDKVTTFIYAKETNEGLHVPKEGMFDLVAGISDLKLTDIMTAIYGGVKAAYAKATLPHMEIEIEELSAYTLGALLQIHMMEVMYLAQLLNVNAFDQPSVELYKEETRKLLES